MERGVPSSLAKARQSTGDQPVMTIRTYKAILAGSAMLALGLSANAAQAATTATANAKAQIVKALIVNKTADLDFGTIVASGTASTVGLTTAGVVTCGATLTCAGTPAAATFTVTGTALQTVSITTTGVTLTGPGTSMTATLAPSVATLPLTAAGADVFKIAGTLNVGVSQVEGAYTGSFTVTVSYS
jgi:hypothetical protein